MKSQLYKAALLAALGLAGVSVAQAQTYTSGDLLVGFTTGSGTDLIYDLGSASSLTSGETFSGLSTLLAADFSSESSLTWGVIGNGPNSGAAGTRTFWTTTAVGVTPGTVQGNSKFGALNSDMGALAENFSGATAAGDSATVASTVSTSWNEITTPNATLGTSYINEYENPNVTGETSDTLSVGVDSTAGITPTALGSFTLGPDDTFTFTSVAVPEPGAFGLMAATGLLVVSLRNQFRRNRA